VQANKQAAGDHKRRAETVAVELDLEDGLARAGPPEEVLACLSDANYHAVHGRQRVVAQWQNLDARPGSGRGARSVVAAVHALALFVRAVGFEEVARRRGGEGREGVDHGCELAEDDAVGL
jgi:hypothetical protein